MKKLLIIILTVLSSNVLAQSDLYRGHQPRDGLYTSMSLGAGFLSVNDKVSNGETNTIQMIGGAGGTNIRIGAPVKDNFVLHGDILAFVSGALTVTGENDIATTSDASTITMRIYGGGATYYFMPGNIFISGSFGLSAFDITNPVEELDLQMGFGLIAKVGKDWFISKNWDIGLSFELAYARSNYETDGMTEILSGFSSGLSFNVTFN